MLSPEHFAVTLARAVDLFRTHPHAVPDQKGALRALVALSKLGGPTVTVDGGQLLVDGAVVPATLPAIAALAGLLDRLGVREIRIGRGASPGDLLNLLQALAVPPEEYAGPEGVEQRLRQSRAFSVSVLSVKSAALLPGEEGERVTEAFQALEIDVEADAAAAAESAAEMATSTAEPAAAAPAAPEVPVTDRVNAVTEALSEDLTRGREREAMEALDRLLAEERAALVGSAARRAYGVALRRLLTPEFLARVAPLVAEADVGAAAGRAVRRAGAEGTELLLGQLAAAPTRAERRAFYEALRDVREGRDLVIRMLDHHEWFVVRNVADLVGELQLVEAVPALIKALSHADHRVKHAAAAALVSIGVAEAIDVVAGALCSSDARSRAAIAEALEGRRAQALVPTLKAVVAEEPHEEARRACYLALGRIGSPEAVQILIKAVRPGGRLFRRKLAGPRLAALEALKLVGGPVVVGALEGLERDAEPAVRQAARTALSELRSRRGRPSPSAG